MCHIVVKFVPWFLIMITSSSAWTCALCYERRLMRIQLPLVSLGSQHVTKVGFTVMIHKQYNSRRSGRAHSHQEQKKKRHGRSQVQQRACSLFFFFVFFLFLSVKGIVHHEFVLLMLLLTLTFTMMFWDTWEKICNENDQNFDATITGSIMTVHPPTRPWKPRSWWLTTTLSLPILPTFQTYPPVFLLVSQIAN
jgi:hypothetical protein